MQGVRPVHKFTAVEISRDREARTITLTQSGYIKELGQRYAGKFAESYNVTGPERNSHEKFRKLQPNNTAGDVPITEYLQLVGSVLWPANMTRPDIAFHCSKLATFCHSATKEHVYYAYCIVVTS